MPVYNESLFVEQAVKSVLNQSLFDFELLIIDDASEDNTFDLINEFNDDRIILIQKEKNTGYTDSLNLGIEKCSGRYIARMDGDDISKKNRFEKQFLYMKKNPHIDILGSNIEVIDFDGKYTKNINFPENNKEISQRLK